MKLLTRITTRHLRAIGLSVIAGAAVSAASLKASKPVEIWVNNQLFHPTTYSARDNGWPFPFLHSQCVGPHLTTCSQYLDGWAVILNVSFWAVMAGLGWMAYRWLTKKTPAKKH